jgi:hypothetical protein
MSAKLVPAFADRGVSRRQRGGSLRPYSRLYRPFEVILRRFNVFKMCSSANYVKKNILNFVIINLIIGN